MDETLEMVHQLVEDIGNEMFAEWIDPKYVICGWPPPLPVMRKVAKTLDWSDCDPCCCD